MPVLSYNERQQLLRAIFGDFVFIVDVYDDSVVVEPYGEGVSVAGEAMEAGGLYKWKYEVDDKGVASLKGKPEQVQRRVKYEKVKYSAVFSIKEFGQDWVRRIGKVWELAYYADKMPVSEDELDRAVANFSPQPINLEHEQTVLDGKLGLWEKCWRVGNEVFGELLIPKWLDDLFKGESLRCSVEFTDDRRFCGIALTNWPRVSDAAVFAAFTAHSKGLRRENPEPQNNGVRMNWFQKLSEWHRTGQWPQDPTKELDDAGYDPAKAAAAFADSPEPKPEPATPDGEDPAVKAMREQMEAQNRQYREQLQAAESVNLGNAAKSLIRSYVDKKKVLPAEVPALEKMYADQVRADATKSGSGCFKADGTVNEGEAVATFKAMLDSRPEFFMTGAAIQGDPNQNPQAGQMSEERRLHLLGMSKHWTAPVKQ